MNNDLNERDLATELAESDDLRDRMSKILRGTANALHGGPLENGYWSWHDLPSLAMQYFESASERERTIEELETTVKSLKAYITDAEKPISDNPNKDVAYVTMVETARAHGVTPLTPEEFAKEDKRMLTDWQRRRMGIDEAEKEFRKQFMAPVRFSFCRTNPPAVTRFPFWTRVRLALRVLRGLA